METQQGNLTKFVNFTFGEVRLAFSQYFEPIALIYHALQRIGRENIASDWYRSLNLAERYQLVELLAEKLVMTISYAASSVLPSDSNIRAKRRLIVDLGYISLLLETINLPNIAAVLHVVNTKRRIMENFDDVVLTHNDELVVELRKLINELKEAEANPLNFPERVSEENLRDMPEDIKSILRRGPPGSNMFTNLRGR